MGQGVAERDIGAILHASSSSSGSCGLRLPKRSTQGHFSNYLGSEFLLYYFVFIFQNFFSDFRIFKI